MRSCDDGYWHLAGLRLMYSLSCVFLLAHVAFCRMEFDAGKTVEPAAIIAFNTELPSHRFRPGRSR
jgi:hypothetical protein